MYSIKDEQKTFTFDNIDIINCKFNCSKHPIDINNVDID